MILKDLHVHTDFSDGKNSIEETVLCAIEKGMNVLGISDHSYTAFDESYCMKKEKIPEYISTVNALKHKYRGKIELLCGIEQDYYSSEDTSAFDYVIGSVHYLYKNGEYFPVDESEDICKAAIIKHYGGDGLSLAEDYFDTVSKVVDKTNADIIGHFDLVSKFNINGALFDESDRRYISAWQKAADILISKNVPFEINTKRVLPLGTEPYPKKEIIDYIIKNGGRFVLSSDSHKSSDLCSAFCKYGQFVK